MEQNQKNLVTRINSVKYKYKMKQHAVNVIFNMF